MTYAGINLGECLTALALLAVGVALAMIAQRRSWRPSLLIALGTAVALRVAVLVLAHRIQPYDLVNDFWAAGIATLHHRDPTLNNRTNGWASLPTYTFVLAGAAWTVVHLHWSWLVVARIPALLCDLGVVVVVGALVTASGGSAEQAALRRFQYACNPVAILVSSVHGQLEPACLLLAFSAMVVVLRGGPGISGRRAVAGGVLLGLAISTQTWPVLFGPALLIALPSWRRRLQAVAGGAVVGAVIFATMPLTVGTPLDKMSYLFKHMTSNQPTIGTWNWAGVWVTQYHTALPVWSDPLWIHVAKIGTKVGLAAALLAVFWWRRGHPLDVATATTTALIVVTPAFGNQYLLWPVPSALARPTRWTNALQIVLGCYAAIFYLPMNMLVGRVWQDVDNGMMFVSLGVAVCMLLALPWHRRVWDRSQPPPPESDDRVRLDAPLSDHI
jgi:Glycosyltransferase family 87